MLLSVLYVRFRDIQPIWDVTSQILFYGSPIIYTVSNGRGYRKCSAELRALHVLNPIARDPHPDAQDAFVDPTRNPSAACAIGGAVRLLIPLGIVVGVFALGLGSSTARRRGSRRTSEMSRAEPSPERSHPGSARPTLEPRPARCASAASAALEAELVEVLEAR